MVPLTTACPPTNPCLPDENTCERVYDWTGNDAARRGRRPRDRQAAGHRGVVLVGLVARWLLHRVIDRIVRRAEDGVLPDRLSRMTRRPEPTEGSDSARSRRMQRARTMGDLLKSIITGVISPWWSPWCSAELDYDIGPILASAGIVGVALGFGAQNLVKDFLVRHLHDLRGPVRRRRLGRPRRGQRHRRGGRPAGHPAPRRRRHRLVRPQRRDPARRQPEPELGAHGARRDLPLPRGRRPGASRARRRSPTTCGTTRTSTT